MHNLLGRVKITRVSVRGAGAASATPTKGTILDMAGWEGVLLIAEMGNVLDTSAVALRVAASDINDTAEMDLLTGSAGGTAAAADYDDKLIVLDVVQPGFRYIEPQIFHVTANAPFDGIIAIQYTAGRTPTTQGSTVKASATLTSPALA
jgi:hypothetical protein